MSPVRDRYFIDPLMPTSSAPATPASLLPFQPLISSFSPSVPHLARNKPTALPNSIFRYHLTLHPRSSSRDQFAIPFARRTLCHRRTYRESTATTTDREAEGGSRASFSVPKIDENELPFFRTISLAVTGNSPPNRASRTSTVEYSFRCRCSFRLRDCTSRKRAVIRRRNGERRRGTRASGLSCFE